MRLVSDKLELALLVAVVLTCGLLGLAYAGDAPLPEGVKVVWDLDKAWRLATPTHEWLCINGLWRWQPAARDAVAPTDNWGFFKVPGAWPGVSDSMQKDCQNVIAHPDWGGVDIRRLTSAWYQRDISIPKEWAGRRIDLRADYVNSWVSAVIDGRPAGSFGYPGGGLDITALCRPGARHRLTLLVISMPLADVMIAYNDANAASWAPGLIPRRGLCGDVYLVSSPKGASIEDLKIDPSVRNWKITFNAAVERLVPGSTYRLKASVTDAGKPVNEFISPPFSLAGLVEGRFSFTADWKPDKLWDIHTPKNMYDVQLSLLDSTGKALDVFRPERFGFREFWIDGRDFYLNGSRIFLSGVPWDNARVSAATAGYDAACESLRRLKSLGVNYVYTHNNNCDPGSHLSFAEILRAADDVGVLVGVTQPLMNHYDWTRPDADKNNNYARHADFYVQISQNHPSVVFYPTSHSTVGYFGDMDPDAIDGLKPPAREVTSSDNAKLALRAEAIIRRLDPTRVVYHHACGDLGAVVNMTFYSNWAPMQEVDDWFQHWASVGVKPLFTCEFGAPFSWDWAMYRGVYRGKRESGGARVPWEFCLAEWNAQLLGDAAYRLSDAEKENLRWEAGKFRARAVWHRWEYPFNLNSHALDERFPVWAMYISSNWRAFRTLGLSANSPWEYGEYWKLRPDVDNSRKDVPVDWDALQRPGYSPDFLDPTSRIDLGYAPADWTATPAAQALVHNNMPLLAYVAGKSAAVTGKDHNFFPGQTVEKQLVVINNSRETVVADCSWSLALPKAVPGAQKVTVKTGDQARVPLSIALPNDIAPGNYDLTATVRFTTPSLAEDKGETQTDTFRISVMAPVAPIKAAPRIALLDPKGETATLLKGLGVSFESANAQTGLADYDIFIVGKGALTVGGAAPDISRVRDGLKVVVFEQTPDVLERRLGFRIAEYGLRNVFKRVSDHPLLAGISSDNLRDWSGEALLQPASITLTETLQFGRGVRWCDIPVTCNYRAGNRGNVGSVLIEKPACGNFLPVLDGGFSLQYSPLMEYREGRGLVLFCQMDVTGRTESDPAALTVVRNIIQYVSTWQSGPTRRAIYVGEAAGKSHLESVGIAAGPFVPGRLAADQVLIVGPTGGQTLAASVPAIADWLKSGGHVIAVGLDESEARSFLPLNIRMNQAEHVGAFFEPSIAISRMAGIGPADVHSREPRQVPLVTSGAKVLGDGVLASGEKLAVSFCQIAPWQYDPEQQNTKRTYRHLSFALSRLLGNMGVSGATPLLDRFRLPVSTAKPEARWLAGFYLDFPEEWDDPYRAFRW